MIKFIFLKMCLLSSMTYQTFYEDPFNFLVHFYVRKVKEKVSIFLNFICELFLG